MTTSIDIDKLQAKLKLEEAVGLSDLDKNPVYEAIARYLGIDLSIEGRAARNRRGVAVIINGAPLTGKTKAASALSKYYDCPIFTIDSIVTDAIANGTSMAASKARTMCAEVATKAADEVRLIEGVDKNNMNPNMVSASGQLSMEALNQHTLNRTCSSIGFNPFGR
jgi:hydrocephalus-inducing protein